MTAIKEKPIITAQKIQGLLKDRHSDDVFVSECKDGATWFGAHLRLDAWAMKKSWANPCTFGYEIKVNRSDFLNDIKWRKYLPLCDQFYFVSPHRLIAPDELPPEAGLMYVTKTGTKCIIKKKAPHREVAIPESLYRYILISRTKILDRDADTGERESEVAFWKGWLEEKKIDFALGRRVRKALAERIEKEIDEVRSENKELKEKQKNLEEVASFLEKIDVSPCSWRREEAIKRAVNAIPKNLDSQLEDCIEQLTETRDGLHKITNFKRVDE